jgi:hypothetical protein
VEPLEVRDVPAALFAASYFDGALYQFDSNTGTLQRTLVAPNSGGLLSGPAGLTLGPDNNLYISSQNSNAILEYNRTTNALSTFIPSSVLGPLATASGNAVFAPAGLRFGPDGDLYVSLNGGQSSSGGGEVIRFGVTSSAGVLSYGGTSTPVATNLLQPSGLTFGTAAGDTDSLYVSSLGIILVGGTPTAAGMVSKVATATTSPTTSTFVQAGSGGLNFAAGLTWGSDGKLYVVDLGATSNNGNILRYQPNGAFDTVFAQTNSSGQGTLQFQFPSDALFDDEGRLVTANLGPAHPPTLQGSIYQYSSSGVFLQTLVASSSFPNTGPGESGISTSQLALALPPVVTGVSPTQGPVAGGTTVTITGTNLGGATQVSFGSTVVTNFLSDTPTQITLVSPAGTGTVDVQVTTANGISATTTADQFAYVPAPTVTLSSTASNPTPTPLIPVTVTFSAPVAGFTASGVKVGNGTVSNFTGSGANYSFNVTASGPGVVTIAVPANVAQDVVGNGNLAATQLTRTFTPAPPIPATLPLSTVAAFDGSTGKWYLRNSNSPGAPSVTPFAYGGQGWTPVTGDWNGDGTFTIGVVDPSTMTWYLRNSNSPGAPDIAAFQFGAVGWIPIVGDWTGSGHTGIGVFDPTTATFYLRTEAGPGAPDAGVIHYGGTGWVPVVGDWDGTGTTTIGVVDPTTMTWYLKNSNTGGAPDIGPFAYGAPSWVPVAGDWGGTGTATIGVVDPTTMTWYLRNANAPGAPDTTPFAYGGANWVPVPGPWAPHLQLLKAQGGATTSSATVTPLTQSIAQTFAGGALARLKQDGVSAQLIGQFGAVQVEVGTLGGGVLAQADPKADALLLDANAAGYGWFVDPTPLLDEEFAAGQAVTSGPAAGRMDLLTAMLQEMGVAAGLKGSALNAPLAPGARQVTGLEAVFAQATVS